MNANQAKKLDLPELMSRLGHTPVRSVKGGREFWYNSPFRDEKEPSFHTSYLGGKWIWNDFGDTGGTVIDFVLRHENLSSVREALAYLSELYQGPLFDRPASRAGEGASAKPPPLFSFQQQDAGDFSGAPDFDQANRGLEFVGEKPLQSPLIFRYLQGRGIPEALSRAYLVLVHYRNLKKPSDKPYFAFGQKNLSGGYEIRSASDGGAKFKSALIKRDITVFPGSNDSSQNVAVFEGMLDHLSLLAFLGVPRLRGDALIMNALSSYERTLSYIREKGYARVDLFLDNDGPGRSASLAFKEDLGAIVHDQAASYYPHKDLNAALVQGASPAFTTQPRQEP